MPDIQQCVLHREKAVEQVKYDTTAGLYKQQPQILTTTPRSALVSHLLNPQLIYTGDEYYSNMQWDANWIIQLFSVDSDFIGQCLCWQYQE